MDVTQPTDWRDEAACRDEDPELFFPEGDPYITAVAKTVCGRCTKTAECLALFIQNNEEFGVWAGMTAYEIRKARKKARTKGAA